MGSPDGHRDRHPEPLRLDGAMSPSDTTELHIKVARLEERQENTEETLAKLERKVDKGNQTLDKLLLEAIATKKAIRMIGWLLATALTAIGIYKAVTG